jgi:hypothetical protein
VHLCVDGWVGGCIGELLTTLVGGCICVWKDWSVGWWVSGRLHWCADGWVGWWVGRWVGGWMGEGRIHWGVGGLVCVCGSGTLH